MRRLVMLPIVVLLAAGCAVPSSSPAVVQGSHLDVAVHTTALADSACSGGFVVHRLEHTTITNTRPIAVYESNGSGLAIGDLNGNGRDDLVLANLGGPSSILWNEGGMRFRSEPLGEGNARGVSIVDVDGDGLLDIVLTRRFDKPEFYRNTGAEGAQRFIAGVLPDVNNTFYTLNWIDLDGDGQLDFVAGSYDTEQLKQQGLIFTQRGGIGVFAYYRDGDTYRADRLSDAADALAISFPDLDGDGRPDIWVANDFNRRDYAWIRSERGWTSIMPSDYISENTMSLDVADIDNDGVPEIMATDMKPVGKDTSTLASWLPMMKLMTRPLTSDDPQHAENTLQVRGSDGRWRNEAYERFVDSSGWSWSGKFGDLDNDGALDLYVVNGMIAAGLFDHLPNSELVEPNMAFRNDGRGYFRHAPEWGLGVTASGRGMSMADLDGDGDLDIVINNLASPSMVLENQLCGGRNLLVDLRWPASGNTRAIGAQLALETSAGTFYRDVRAASGYLSGDTSLVHFGIPDGATIEQLRITWPDTMRSIVEHPEEQTRIQVVR
ncbi:MAG TPA: CRTAC1 family protein [Roseiflexaceae bacterium]|nr:CRTAC1 family protein [Roseiflexaceae bacterium]